MTVKELMEELQGWPKGREIYIHSAKSGKHVPLRMYHFQRTFVEKDLSDLSDPDVHLTPRWVRKICSKNEDYVLKG
jgi:hypothetical protein